MVPTTREQYKDFCLRQLGSPVIQINVSDQQVDDCVDICLRYWWDYHFDGSDKVFYKHQLTQEDITNRYITIPENIIGAVKIFSLGMYTGRGDFFDIRYQIALNDLYTLTSVSMIPYYMAFQHIQMLEQLLVGQAPMRYNRHMNRAYLDTNWEKYAVGEYMLVEAYQIVDPTVYTNVWGDRWLWRYGTAQIKKVWGSNLKKFSGVVLPGGVQFNGQQIYNEAVQEIAELEHEMITTYSLPVSDFIY